MGVETGVVVMEYPTYEGSIPPLEEFKECFRIAQKAGAHVHVDGARLFTALSQSKIPPADLIKCCSSLTFCLTKCLLAPIGSIVVGDRNFINAFKMNRRMLGGELRKPGLLASTGLRALEGMRM